MSFSSLFCYKAQYWTLDWWWFCLCFDRLCWSDWWQSYSMSRCSSGEVHAEHVQILPHKSATPQLHLSSTIQKNRNNNCSLISRESSSAPKTKNVLKMEDMNKFTEFLSKLKSGNEINTYWFIQHFNIWFEINLLLTFTLILENLNLIS